MAPHASALAWRFHGLHRPWGGRESDRTERLSLHQAADPPPGASRLYRGSADILSSSQIPPRITGSILFSPHPPLHLPHDARLLREQFSTPEWSPFRREKPVSHKTFRPGRCRICIFSSRTFFFFPQNDGFVNFCRTLEITVTVHPRGATALVPLEEQEPGWPDLQSRHLYF